MSTNLAKKAVGAPSIEFEIDDFLASVKSTLQSRMLTNGGVQVQTFEKKISEYVGAKHAICVCNATIGLQVALKALNLSGKIIVPSFTYVATAHACEWIGIEVLFCEIDETTLLMDTKHLELLVQENPNVTAIIPVHVYGRACNFQEIEAIAKKYALKVVYDAAHAFGSRYSDFSKVGTKGDCEVFSFHATKSLSSMEGGAIVTNNDHLATMIRRLINFGFQGYDNVTEIGTNAKMCEIAALYGQFSLSQFEKLAAHNFTLFSTWKRLFQEKSYSNDAWRNYVQLLDGDEKCNMHYQVVVFKKNPFNISRDDIHELLLAKLNVLTRKYFYPGVHLMPAYKKKAQKLPKTEEIAEGVICFPTGFQMTVSDIELIFSVIAEFWDMRS
jgi:dTDP-4-amino-4,6-dideoxygalactose transaminase